jgi:hypothetical protein
MPSLSRRSFLASLASAVPLAVVVRRAHAATVEHLQTDAATLTALAETVLPAVALGKAGVSKAAIAFREWGTGYRESAELNHGYGTSRLRSSGPTPLTKWATQLDDLDKAAHGAHGKRFHEIAVPQRADLVRAALQGQRIDRIPAVSEASHVSLALIAHFYDSSVATDLCYQAQIGRQTCRPLSTSSRKPLPFLKVSER